jgi:hypothetical protein
MKRRAALPRWSEAMADPGLRAIAVLGGVLVGGFVLLGIAWHGTAGTVHVPLQLPWLVSAGLAGLAVVGMAAGALSIHLGRRQDAAHRDAVETLVRDAIELCEDLRRRG